MKRGGFNLPNINLKCEGRNLQWFFHYLGNPEADNWKIMFREENREILEQIEYKDKTKKYKRNYYLNTFPKRYQKQIREQQKRE